MSRSYRVNLAHHNAVYQTEDVMALYHVAKNTITNWIAQGLQPVPGTRPHLFRGDELKRFHQDRSRLGSTHLNVGEFKCFGCKAAVLPDPNSLEFSTTRSGADKVCGSCPDCDKPVFKIVNATECTMLRSGSYLNTTGQIRDESEETLPSGVGISRGNLRKQNPNNDRLIYEWQVVAGKYAELTRIAHLVSIRDFEAFIGAKDFAQVTTRDADQYRKTLISGYRSTDEAQRLSQSTVRHRASHLKKFFEVLSRLPDLHRLQLVADCFDLPKALEAEAPSDEPRLSLELEEARRILGLLPRDTLTDLRNCAMVALAYMTGMREGSLTSLCIKHVDMRAKTTVQAGRTMRAKNGKIMKIGWFPRTEGFHAVFEEWFEKATHLGLTGEDALFPDTRHLQNAARFWQQPRPPIPVMKSAQALVQVFEKMSSLAGRKFTPHSVRNTLARLGDGVCRAPLLRQAWSENFGHESQSTTWGTYAKLGEERRLQVLESFSVIDTLTNDERDLLLQLQLGALPNSDRDYWRATSLLRRLQDEMAPSSVGLT